MALVDELETSIGARLKAATLLTALLKGGADGIVWGWPVEILDDPEASQFPIVTYYVTAFEHERPGIGDGVLVLDEWEWPSNTLDSLGAIDDEIEDLFDEAQWTTATGQKVAVLGMSVRTWPSGAPLRRTRTVLLGL